MNGEFRVYDTKQKKYVTDDKEWLVSSNGELFYSDYDLIGCPDCAVEWCSGLTDKNGARIFEGDIVSLNKLLGIYVVRFNNEQCRFSMYLNGTFEQAGFNKDTMENYEIIGNIYDNPELLNDKND